MRVVPFGGKKGTSLVQKGLSKKNQNINKVHTGECTKNYETIN